MGTSLGNDNYDIKPHVERINALAKFCFDKKLGYELEIFQTYVTVFVKDQSKGVFFSGSGLTIPDALNDLIASMQKVGYV